ncbi:ankyrin repeat domain-containing protein [Parasphaerochaeta coccoides]|uniref:Ankyrin n=1 Tax=Parasphaerochaeta coccoides (strain ATCC BAA-1237 / DSM 17374 / SPN1) TaxID=760011 RepID=F4GJT5_PARC1|nr:ankyrin repeat domain-containing protein [Parasphaerochaeta coccoides]AEC01360.1 Ankyrin [Parasphaerochaeta coccoides DSM 17374]
MAKNTETLNRKLLAAAVKATKAKVVKDLLMKGADANCHNEWGMTPLMLAAQYNKNVAVTKALLAAGADIREVEPKYCSNALHLAADKAENPKVIEALLDAGADLNVRNYLGETPLIMAVNANPETRIVSTLLKEGADVNARDYQGHSVLEYAKAGKRNYIISQLKKKGAT